MKYRYSDPPENVHNVTEILLWLRDQLLEIESTLESLEANRISLTTLHAAPDKPRQGNIVRADGTNWNPGSGEGVYDYTSGGSWNKL